MKTWYEIEWRLFSDDGDSNYTGHYRTKETAEKNVARIVKKYGKELEMIGIGEYNDDELLDAWDYDYLIK